MRLKSHTSLIILQIIVFLLHAPSGIEADQCPYLDVTFRSTSEWADFTDIAEFVSIPNEIAINQVITQLSELKGVIDSFKAQYVQNTFHESYESQERRFGHMSFPWLIPSKLKRLLNNQQHPNTTWSAYFSTNIGERRFLKSSYGMFQRFAIGLEVVVKHLQSEPTQYVIKKGNFWTLAYAAANRVVEAIYILLKSKNFHAERQPFISREIVPIRVSCMPEDETQLNTRDWIILYDSLQILKFYQPLFDIYLQN